MKAISCDLAKIKRFSFLVAKGRGIGSSQTARGLVRILLGYPEENWTKLYR